jgi:hypothetical protein
MPADYLIPSKMDGFRLPRAESLPVTPWSMSVGEPDEDAESDVPEVEPEPEKSPAKKSPAKQSASAAAPAEQEK